MQFGAVALVLAETIFGKLRAEVTHHSVPGDFGDHARGRDRKAVTIALDDRRLRKWKWKNRQPIDQNVFWRNAERPERYSHCFVRCSQNVDSIDFQMVDDADPPRDFRAGHELVVDLFTKIRI